MSRLLRFLLTIFGALIVVLGGVGTGEPGFVAAATDPTPPVSSTTDEPVYSLAHYRETRFDSLSLPHLDEGQAGTTAPSALLPWSKIVFQSFQDTNYEIFVMNNDGGEMVRLTNDPGNDIHPRLNQDASRIVFASQRGGDYEIFVINRVGTGLQQLTFNDRGDVDPVWSPDGTHRAFQSYHDGHISYVNATVSPISTQPLVWDVGDLAGGSGPFTIGVTLAVSPSAPTMVTRTIALELGSQTPELFVANNNLVHPLFVGARLMLPLLLK